MAVLSFYQVQAKSYEVSVYLYYNDRNCLFRTSYKSSHAPLGLSAYGRNCFLYALKLVIGTYVVALGLMLHKLFLNKCRDRDVLIVFFAQK